MSDTHNDEAEETYGTLYTHSECPHCGEGNEHEGDKSGEEVECEHCAESYGIYVGT